MEKLFRLNSGTNQITTHLSHLKRAAESSAESKCRRVYTELGTEQLKQLVVMWFASYSVSFRMVENTHFRNFLIFLNSDVKKILPNRHKTTKLGLILE